MKRFLSVIFWRKDPSAGVLFGMALCVGLGLLVMAYGIMLAMTLNWSNINVRLLSLTKGLFALFFGLLFYILTLFCLWLTDLFQRTFKLSKWAAIPCGWLTGMVGMAVCAWKLKNRQAFVLAVAASLLFAAHVILKVNGSDLGVWLDVCSFACDGTFFLAFCALVRRRSFYIWGIVLLVLWLLVGYVIRNVVLAHLERNMTSRIETLPQDCRVQLTREMVRGELEAHEQPIPETFQEFLDASRFPSNSLIGHFDAITDKAYVVSAGIAVERYRRRYHRLPETLEHLVPEFIGQAPVSVMTGLPLGYETGKITIPQPDDEPEFFINGYRVDNGDKSYFIVAMPEEKP